MSMFYFFLYTITNDVKFLLNILAFFPGKPSEVRDITSFRGD
jgi:hypothetical protein